MQVGCKEGRGRRGRLDSAGSLSKWLGGKLVELLQCDLLGGYNGGDDFASARCQHVSMGVGNLLNQMVGAQHAQQA